MTDLSELERRILVELEKRGGEEQVWVFANLMGEAPRNSTEDLASVSAALIALLNRRYIETAEHISPSSVEWWRLTKDKSLALLKDLQPFSRWSPQEHAWKWSDKKRLWILLTEEGSGVAHQIISA